jgi:hypothetical protein
LIAAVEYRLPDTFTLSYCMSVVSFIEEIEIQYCRWLLLLIHIACG